VCARPRILVAWPVILPAADHSPRGAVVEIRPPPNARPCGLPAISLGYQKNAAGRILPAASAWFKLASALMLANAMTNEKELPICASSAAQRPPSVVSIFP